MCQARGDEEVSNSTKFVDIVAVTSSPHCAPSWVILLCNQAMDSFIFGYFLLISDCHVRFAFRAASTRASSIIEASTKHVDRCALDTYCPRHTTYDEENQPFCLGFTSPSKQT